MANEAHALSREEQVRALTAYSGVTTADGSSSKNSLIDSALIGKNDFLTGKSVLIMSGSAKWETSGISGFNSTTGEITFGDALSAQIVAGVSFRVLNTLPESLHITSGQVQIMGYDYESGEWRKVRVTGSGEIAIAVTVADIVTAKISGQTVYLASGTGPILAKISGESLIATVSGQPIKVSGEVVQISGQAVTAKVSGETMIAKVSGETIIAKVSGETVTAKVSGEVVKISGETVTAKVSGEVVKVSGETISIETPTTVKTGPIQVVTAASGGQVLHSGAVKSAIVRANTGNSGNIAVGGSSDRPWLAASDSGQGIILDAAEAASLDIDDFDKVYVVAEVSGDRVSFIGVN